MHDQPQAPPLPTLAQLGPDLVAIGPLRRAWTLALPFASLASYLFLAASGFWIPAVGVVMYLSFLTYGSISHDLVHRALGLPRPVNESFLTAIELLAFRSGHAYRLAHLQHHARFPHDDDVEGAAARMPFWRALLEGFIYIPRLTLWALRTPHRRRRLVIAEVVAACGLFVACLAVIPVTPLFAVYAALMVMGTWVFPLVTAYLPHNAHGPTPLTRTRLFRGKVLAILALQHLYHLEHHLYPSVPHHHWPTLARRLDPYFAAAKIDPIVLGF
jgi:beta-carotene hydroxylase